jgi:hypothetical protein
MQSLTKIDSNEEEELMKYLFNEKYYMKAEIHGLTPTQIAKLDNMIQNNKILENLEENETEVNAPNIQT